jgi:hypothetical protein
MISREQRLFPSEEFLPNKILITGLPTIFPGFMHKLL